jgi:hypothetical protein
VEAIERESCQVARLGVCLLLLLAEQSLTEKQKPIQNWH